MKEFGSEQRSRSCRESGDDPRKTRISSEPSADVGGLL